MICAIDAEAQIVGNVLRKLDERGRFDVAEIDASLPVRLFPLLLPHVLLLLVQFEFRLDALVLVELVALRELLLAHAAGPLFYFFIRLVGRVRVGGLARRFAVGLVRNYYSFESVHFVF